MRYRSPPSRSRHMGLFLLKAKAELLLGRSESERFRRAFDRAGGMKDGGLTVAEAARACQDLGGRTTETKVK